MNTEQVKALVTLIITLAANIANVCGFAFDFDTWLQLGLSAASVISVIWCWWKNQNMTQAAQQAQQYLDLLKIGADVHIVEGQPPVEEEE